MKSAIVRIGGSEGLPWWWDEVQLDSELCNINIERVNFRNKKSKQISTLDLPFLSIKILLTLLRLRKKYDYIFTFECDHATFFLSFWQTILFFRRPKHVVLQFIMREKVSTLSSKIKYAVMRFCFHSLHKIICSSTQEAEYYKKVFKWNEQKVAFVPFHTSRKFVADEIKDGEDYVLSAGRVFRDFNTLVIAAKDINQKVCIVASPNAVKVPEDLKNVKILFDIPFDEFERLIKNCQFVVIPLEDRQISVGQLVILHAMALGKPVITTRTAGTVDYIVNGENGILVEPGNPDELRERMKEVASDLELRLRLGKNARNSVLEKYLPHHYTSKVREVLMEKKI